MKTAGETPRDVVMKDPGSITEVFSSPGLVRIEWSNVKTGDLYFASEMTPATARDIAAMLEHAADAAADDAEKKSR